MSVVRRHLTKRNKQLKFPKAKIINLALLPTEKPGTINALSQASLYDFNPDFSALEPEIGMDESEV